MTRRGRRERGAEEAACCTLPLHADGMLRCCQVPLALLLTIEGRTQIISIESAYNEIAAFHTIIQPLNHAADALARAMRECSRYGQCHARASIADRQYVNHATHVVEH